MKKATGVVANIFSSSLPLGEALTQKEFVRMKLGESRITT